LSSDLSGMFPQQLSELKHVHKDPGLEAKHLKLMQVCYHEEILRGGFLKQDTENN